MIILTKVLDNLRRAFLWIAMVFIVLMMVTIAVGVISQLFGHPIVGIVEFVEILMVILIMFSFTHTQSKDGHIKIGIIVDHLPKWAQNSIDVLSYVATAILCFIISYIFMGAGLKDMNVTKETTLMLELPIYILKFVTAVGFLLWGLEALNRMIKLFLGMEKVMIQSRKEEESA